MPRGDRYFLGHGSTEQQRLQQQAAELAADSVRLFDRARLAPGSRVVEIGCGPQGCLEILGHRVGPQGSVVGVEVSEEAVALARAFVSHRRLDNVDVRHADARTTGLPRNSFDLATGRLVLINVPAPEEIVAEMAALVKPGGIVALHEADWKMGLCDPPLPAWDRLSDAFLTYSRARTGSICSSAAVSLVSCATVGSRMSTWIPWCTSTRSRTAGARSSRSSREISASGSWRAA